MSDHFSWDVAERKLVWPDTLPNESRKNFIDFCNKNFTNENIDFLIEMENYLSLNSTADKDAKQIKAQEILKQFIEPESDESTTNSSSFGFQSLNFNPDSPIPINIEDKNKRALLQLQDGLFNEKAVNNVINDVLGNMVDVLDKYNQNKNNASLLNQTYENQSHENPSSSLSVFEKAWAIKDWVGNNLISGLSQLGNMIGTMLNPVVSNQNLPHSNTLNSTDSERHINERLKSNEIESRINEKYKDFKPRDSDDTYKLIEKKDNLKLIKKELERTFNLANPGEKVYELKLVEGYLKEARQRIYDDHSPNALQKERTLSSFKQFKEAPKGAQSDTTSFFEKKSNTKTNIKP